MDKNKKLLLEANGWRLGSTTDFPGLTAGEEAYIELKLSLSEALRRRRKDLGHSQQSFSKIINSSQSREAKMESGDPSVTVDLVIRGLFATGISVMGIAEAIEKENKQKI
jgi:hypothetical protein